MTFLGVTVTGVDVRTDLAALPDCEIGVLYTETPEGRNRYSSWYDVLSITKQLVRLGRKVAIHICGSRARRRLFDGELVELTALAQRIQVNGRLDQEELHEICYLHPSHQIITQANAWNRCLLDAPTGNHAILVDGSGGRGISPSEWLRPETDKPVGFAGGLGAHNIVAQLPLIHAVAQGAWWIDMEGLLRDEDDWFDVERANAVVDAVKRANLT